MHKTSNTTYVSKGGSLVRGEVYAASAVLSLKPTPDTGAGGSSLVTGLQPTCQRLKKCEDTWALLEPPLAAHTKIPLYIDI